MASGSAPHSVSDGVLCSVVVGKDVSVRVRQCSWEDVGVEVLVVPTIASLAPVGGMAHSVAQAAGPEFVRSCSRLVKAHPRPFGMGEAIRMGSFRASEFGIKQVIQTVAPGFRADLKGAMTGAVVRCLEEAEEAGAKSIAIPMIGAGGRGWPPTLASRAIIRGVRTWVRGFGASVTPSIREILLFDRREACAQSFTKVLLSAARSTVSSKRGRRPKGRSGRGGGEEGGDGSEADGGEATGGGGAGGGGEGEDGGEDTRGGTVDPVVPSGERTEADVEDLKAESVDIAAPDDFRSVAPLFVWRYRDIKTDTMKPFPLDVQVQLESGLRAKEPRVMIKRAVVFPTDRFMRTEKGVEMRVERIPFDIHLHGPIPGLKVKARPSPAPVRVVFAGIDSIRESSGSGGGGSGGSGGDGKSSRRGVVEALGDAKVEEINYSDLRISAGDIGSGSFGVVRHAVWRGMDVAVKVLREADEIDVMNEVNAMARVSNHDCVVRLCGIVREPFAIVSKFLPHGSVENLLVGKDREKLPTNIVAKMAADAAAGVSHLHHHGIIHRDLASRNLLVDDNFRVQVADFGLARVKETGRAVGRTYSDIGAIRYFAPESFRKEYSEKTDVYAFGVTLWEMFVGRVPWEELELWEVADAVRSGRKLEVPPEVPPPIKDLIEQCFLDEPSERPSMEEIHAKLAEFATPTPEEEEEEEGGGEEGEEEDEEDVTEIYGKFK